MAWLENILHLPAREIMPGLHGRFFESEQMSLVYWEIDKDALLPEHQHAHEQVAHILEGIFELTIGDETKQLGKGAFAIIPGHTVHRGRAITACNIVDVFYPKREDYRFG